MYMLDLRDYKEIMYRRDRWYKMVSIIWLHLNLTI